MNEKKDLKEKLLITCVRSDAAAHQPDISRLIAQGADLEELGAMARDKGVSSLVHRALMFYKPAGECEEKALRALRISHLSILALNDFYKEELRRILRCFAENDVSVIPLKGLILSERLYGDITSRDRSVDTDLLVKEGDRERSRGILEGLGYKFSVIDETKENQWYHRFDKPNGRMIELHWDITMMVRSERRIGELWHGAVKAKWEGIDYYDLGPDELLLYLSAHMVNSDSFRKLKYVCDVDRLLEKYGGEINWTNLLETARRWRLSGSLYAALKITGDIFGAKFPAGILNELKLSLSRRMFIRLFANEGVILKRNMRRRALDDFLSYSLFELVESESLKDFARVLRKIFLPPAETMRGRSYIGRALAGLSNFRDTSQRVTGHIPKGDGGDGTHPEGMCP